MSNEEMSKILKQARDTYGNKNQILVCIEELNELACVLAKFPRYDNEEEARRKLVDAVLDEVSDVKIILDHVQNIFELSDEEVLDRMKRKTDRLKRWLDASDSMQQTTIDRSVEPTKEAQSCETCANLKSHEYGRCDMCYSAEAIEGVKPFYKKG